MSVPPTRCAALAHPDDSVSASAGHARRRLHRDPVADDEGDRIRAPNRRHRHGSAVAVTQSVGERLLQDAEDRAFDGGGRGHRGGRNLGDEHESGVPQLSEQALEVAQDGLGTAGWL